MKRGLWNMRLFLRMRKVMITLHMRMMVQKSLSIALQKSRVLTDKTVQNKPESTKAVTDERTHEDANEGGEIKEIVGDE